jgi:hypothetical protein
MAVPQENASARVWRIQNTISIGIIIAIEIFKSIFDVKLSIKVWVKMKNQRSMKKFQSRFD